MPNVNLSTSETEMKGDLYIFIATPKSNYQEIFKSILVNSQDPKKSCFLIPGDEKFYGLSYSNWELIDSEFSFQSKEFPDFQEYFLLFSNKLNLADQIEATLDLFRRNKGLELIRIITLLDSNLLVQTINGLKEWIDSCAHFSDALCFTNRNNENSSAIKELTERYKSMCYPMETFILSSKKDTQINQILKPVSLRVTHIFDNPELLEPEDTPENDYYLECLSNGIRKNVIPICDFT